MHSNSQSGNPLLCFCAIPHNLTTSDLIPNEFNLCLSILFYFVSSLFHFVPFCAALPHNLTTSDLIHNEFNVFFPVFFRFCFFLVLFCAVIAHNFTNADLNQCISLPHSWGFNHGKQLYFITGDISAVWRKKIETLKGPKFYNFSFLSLWSTIERASNLVSQTIKTLFQFQNSIRSPHLRSP